MRALLVLVAAVALIAVAGCSNTNKNPVSDPPTGNLRVMLTDAAGPYDAVNIVITKVEVHLESGDTLSQWQTLTMVDNTFDLLKLQNGVFAALAVGTVPPGHYDQVRLMLGPGSNVIVGGVTYPLDIPSGLQTGLKLIGDFTVPATGMLELGLDFDAMRSIHQTGNGKYMLRPTVQMVPTTQVGAISGTIVPDSTEAFVYAISGVDTLRTTMPALDGTFGFSLLPVGTYDVGIHPLAGFRDTTIAGVAVMAQQTTALGEVHLTAK